jgi:hypothetical protein
MPSDLLHEVTGSVDAALGRLTALDRLTLELAVHEQERLQDYLALHCRASAQEVRQGLESLDSSVARIREQQQLQTQVDHMEVPDVQRELVALHAKLENCNLGIDKHLREFRASLSLMSPMLPQAHADLSNGSVSGMRNITIQYPLRAPTAGPAALASH